jgi:thiol-disulfide isomerase/thioredoxin
MKNKLALIILLLVAITSCKRNNNITIKGDIKGLNTKWIYLRHTFPIGGKANDSARVIDGKFTFEFHPDTTFLADLIEFNYTDDSGKKGGLSFINPYEKNTSFYGDILMEPGETVLTGDLTKNPGITVKSGLQNNFYFKNQTLPYIRISGDTNRRRAQAQRIKNLIKETPDAYWGLYAFENLKYGLTNQQLSSIYNEFDDVIKSSYQGKMIKEFIENQPVSKDQLTNSDFADKDSKPVNLVDNNKKLNMVIFWASWCGPCRHEIPELKNIQSAFKADSNIRFVSVSVDENKEKWLKAMDEEKMPWEQLIIPAKAKNKASALYNLGFVPQIFIVNNKNKVIKKVDGFDAGNENVVKAFITDYLAKN